jgi:tetratricopeptide (TPR) repeat protein
LFEQAHQAIREQQDYPALLHLAQEHLPHIRTPQEHAACLLAASEALIHLQRYQEARQEYLEPALELVGVPPETRLHLWHYLGLSHLAEQRFTDAAAAFRQSADLALGQHFASTVAHTASQRAQLHHVRNAARFYEGVIHLIYQRPQQAVQSLQELHRPLTAVGAFNVALFLGMAYRALQQPEAAIRALQALTRTATCPETLPDLLQWYVPGSRTSMSPQPALANIWRQRWKRRCNRIHPGNHPGKPSCIANSGWSCTA